MKEKDESDLDEKIEEPEAEKSESHVEEKPEKEDKLDDAIDDIKTHDTDELLKTEKPKPHDFAAPKESRLKRFIHNKKVAIPTCIVALILLLLIIPFTRYSILGLFLKQTYSLTVVDSQTGQPVSSASVTLAGKTATTDNHGNAHVKAKVGNDSLAVSKKYYSDLSTKVTVGLKSHAATTFKLQATGRQVPLTVTDKISGNPIENATVTAADTEAKTDKNGQVTIVLPPDKSTISATISATSYNNNPVTIQVTSTPVKANDFQLTPAGKIYFLSNLSGKIDVVETNLDGTDRQTVLAGTGNEDAQNTALLATTDWKYLALYSIRDTSGKPQINLIDTSNNQVTNIDKGSASFELIGWSDHYFVYEADGAYDTTTSATPQTIKSYDADTGKLVTLDQTKTQTLQGNFGTPTTLDENTTDSFSDQYLVGSELLYIVNWNIPTNGSGWQFVTPVPSDAIRTINVDGQNLKDLKTFDSTKDALVQATNYEPGVLYVKEDLLDGTTDYFKVDNNSVSTLTGIDASTYYQGYPTYLISPSGNQTFWSESRDGKNTLFVGDANGDNGKQIAQLSDYTPYGWFTDNYLLVEKNGSELYIMPVSGGTALKISDYYKPAQNFNGYGSGYGGL